MKRGRAWARPAMALAAAGLLMPPVAALAPLAIAPLLPLAALTALAMGGHRDLWRLQVARPLVTLLALIGLWGAASAAWSILPWHSFEEGLRFLAISAGGLVLVATALGLDDAEREQVRRAFVCGFCIALVLLAAAALAHALWQPLPADNAIARWLYRFTRFDRGATTVALAVWPLSLGITGQHKAAWLTALLLATLVVVFALASHAAMLCLLMGLATWPVARRLPRATAAVLGTALIAIAAILPAFPLSMGMVAHIHDAAPSLSGSIIHRLAIWHFAIDEIAQRPLLGWGLDASRSLPGGSDIIRDPRLPDLARLAAPWMPLHPHNAVLQWRLELGLPGAALCTLAVLWLLGRLGSASTAAPVPRARAMALVAGALVVALVSYGFWQAWWQCSLWITAALAVALARDEPPAPDGA